jgi:hypothetical protein
MIVLLLWYWQRHRPLGGLRVGLGAVLLGVGVAVMGLLRSGVNGGGAAIGRGLLNDLLSEMRTLGTARLYVATDGLWSREILTVLSGLVPGRLLELVGIDKAAYFRPIGGEILASIPAYKGYELLGLRITVVGEVFLGFGVLGVLVLSLAIGFVVGLMRGQVTNGTGSTCGTFHSAVIGSHANGTIPSPYIMGAVLAAITYQAPLVEKAWVARIS